MQTVHRDNKTDYPTGGNTKMRKVQIASSTQMRCTRDVNM